MTLSTLFARCFFFLFLALSCPALATGNQKATPLPAAMQEGVPAAQDIAALAILDLPTAKQIALANNPTLAAATARVDQARARVQQASAAYWPQLDITASASRQELSNNDFQKSLAAARMVDPAATLTDPEEYYSNGVTASWLLFDGFARKFTKLSARYSEQESQQAREDSSRLLLSSVAESFYAAQLARENIAIAEANQSFNQRQVTEAEARYKIGTGSLSDILTFTIQVNSAKADMLSARQEYEISMSGLAALMGLESSFPPRLELQRLEDETEAEMLRPELELLTQTALRNRPDISQKEYGVKRAASEEQLARASFYPAVKLAAGLDGKHPHNPDFENDDFGNSITLSLSYNLFNGGSSRARVSEALAGKRAAAKELQALIISVQSAARTALTRLRLAQEQLLLQRSNADLVQQNRELVQKEFAAGQASLIRLNEAQRDLTKAQGRLALGIVALRQAWQTIAVISGQEVSAWFTASQEVTEATDTSSNNPPNTFSRKEQP